MNESPGLLQEICVKFICDNIDTFCAVAKGNNSPESDTAISNGHLVVKHGDIFFHSELSEQLISMLSEKGKLSDLTMTLFDSKTTRLRNVKINANMLSIKGLRVFKAHRISNLEAINLRVTVNELIGCLGEWTLQNLRSLNVSRSSFIDGSRYCVVVALSKLHNLQSLNVSGTEFNSHGLGIVAEDLPLLENLDISNTYVDDICPLRNCKERLKSLHMYNIKVPGIDFYILLELSALRVLDISGEKDNQVFDISLNMFSQNGSKVACFLKQAIDKLLHLTYLDISGNDVDILDLKMFLRQHKKLVFLGLMHSDICFDECFVNPQHPEHNEDLMVTGTATEKQIMETLKRYTTRPSYFQKCLYHLFREMPDVTDARSDIIKLVLPGMKLHTQQFGLQMAATACLYNLTRGDLAHKIHPNVLKKVVELTLIAMDSYPNHYQLQKNTLLTLCNDRILQDVTFDKYQCARLVMNCLCNFDDVPMNRMSVAICSILAAKISTNETSLLGAQPKYMRKLLDIVEAKLITRNVDITIKFTLSALWNLTDESPTTCSVFLEEAGMELFLRVLEIFQGESAVETKVLGLINNIAEVSHLRNRLMKPEFIFILRKLLHSTHIDVSYFAAGIIAHLASDGCESWTVSSIPRDVLLEELGNVVTEWETPEGEMVAYRSFRPFFPLLTCCEYHQVQLWAVWAIQHVCTKNAKRYCPMLVGDGASMILHQLWQNQCTNSRVRKIIESILDVLTEEKVNWSSFS